MNCFGDLPLAKLALQKAVAIFETTDAREHRSLFPVAFYGGLNGSCSLWERAGLGDVSLKLLKALHLSFNEVEESSAVYHEVMQHFGFRGERHVYAPQSFLIRYPENQQQQIVMIT